jgi:AcrR family transcriptional regulator
VTDHASHPGEDYLSTLPVRAQHLLNAARRLLLDDGFASLKWERIAREANEPKAMIRYYFKDTAGLLSALLRVLSEETMQGLVELSETLPTGPERIHAAVSGLQEATRQPWYLAIFEVLPHAMHDDKLRAQIAEAYRRYRQMNQTCFGVAATPENAADLAALAALFSAAADGIAIQAVLDPLGFDADPVFAKVEQAFRVLLRDTDATGR